MQKLLLVLALIGFSQASSWLFDFRFLQECPVDAPGTINAVAVCPALHHVTLDSLPEPYASESVAKFSTTIPIPDDALLNVPRGFAVNIFAEGLNTPRWLALTPDNNVLVSTPSSNSIYLL